MKINQPACGVEIDVMMCHRKCSPLYACTEMVSTISYFLWTCATRNNSDLVYIRTLWLRPATCGGCRIQPQWTSRVMVNIYLARRPWFSLPLCSMSHALCGLCNMSYAVCVQCSLTWKGQSTVVKNGQIFRMSSNCSQKMAKFLEWAATFCVLSNHTNAWQFPGY